MFFLRKKTDSFELSPERFDELIKIIEELGFQKISESQSILGSIDLVSFEYKKENEKISVTLDNYSEIDVIGTKGSIDFLKSRLRVAEHKRV